MEKLKTEKYKGIVIKNELLGNIYMHYNFKDIFQYIFSFYYTPISFSIIKSITILHCQVIKFYLELA